MHLHQTRSIQYTFVGVALAVVGTGVGVASAAGAFSPTITEPNTTLEAEQMQNLQAEYLPAILGEEAAAQEGTSYTLPSNIATALKNAGVKLSGGTVSPQEAANLSSLEGQLATLNTQLKSTPPTLAGAGRFSPSTTNPAYTQLESQIKALNGQIKSAKGAGGDTANFQGEGTAQVQGTIEQQLAAGQLAEGQQYDPQFIAQQLAEEQQADPQQFAARQAEYQMMENAVNNPQTSPVSQTMENQIQQRVNASSGLTPEEQSMLNAAVASQPNEGTSGSQPNFANDLTTGFAGEARDLGNTEAGASFLESGQTPADIAYRQQQANLGNLSSYISGQTPESQFSSLTGAQTGPTPNYESGYQPSYNGQAAAATGASGAATQYGENVSEQLQVPNEWTSGLSTVLGGANVLAAGGVI